MLRHGVNIIFVLGHGVITILETTVRIFISSHCVLDTDKFRVWSKQWI